MTRLIDADKLRMFLDRQYHNCHGYSGNKKEVYREALRAVKSYVHREGQINATDVAPVVHGYWIIGVDNADFDVKCSKCEWTNIFEVAGIAAVERITKTMHYCPNCGAKMNEVSE